MLYRDCLKSLNCGGGGGSPFIHIHISEKSGVKMNTMVHNFRMKILLLQYDGKIGYLVVRQKMHTTSKSKYK